MATFGGVSFLTFIDLRPIYLCNWLNWKSTGGGGGGEGNWVYVDSAGRVKKRWSKTRVGAKKTLAKTKVGQNKSWPK